MSATEAIFTARTCQSFKKLYGMEKKQKEKQTTHKSLKRESQIEAKSSLIKVCTAQLPSKTLKSLLVNGLKKVL